MALSDSERKKRIKKQNRAQREKRKARRLADPEFDAEVRKKGRESTRKHRERNKNDPEFLDNVRSGKREWYHKVKNDPQKASSSISMRKRYQEDEGYREHRKVLDKKSRLKRKDSIRAYMHRPDVRAHLNALRKERIHTDPEYKAYIYSFHKRPEFVERRKAENRLRYRTDPEYRRKMVLARRKYVEDEKRTATTLQMFGFLWSFNSQEVQDVVNAIHREEDSSSQDRG